MRYDIFYTICLGFIFFFLETRVKTQRVNQGV